MARKGTVHPTSHGDGISVLSNRPSPMCESIRDYLYLLKFTNGMSIVSGLEVLGGVSGG